MSKYVIVGASSGIGLALAKQLVEQGHEVIGTYLNSEVDENLGIQYQKLDTTLDPLDFEFDGSNIDGLVYCPGSINLKPFGRIKAGAFLDDYNLQVVGAIKVLQKLMPQLKAENGASVVFFSTVAVQKGFNFHAQVAASKGAIEGLTKALAAELAPTIRVNAVAPSLTDTPLAAKLISSQEKIDANAGKHPLKRLGTADDIANMAAFLLSEKSSWITGQIFGVDGGVSTIKI